MVTTFTADSKKPILQSATLQVICELLLHVLGQEPIFGSKLGQKPRVMLIHNLVEQRLIGR